MELFYLNALKGSTYLSICIHMYARRRWCVIDKLQPKRRVQPKKLNRLKRALPIKMTAETILMKVRLVFFVVVARNFPILGTYIPLLRMQGHIWHFVTVPAVVHCNIKFQCWLLWHIVIQMHFHAILYCLKVQWVRKCIRWFFDPVFISM
jgi:hypothetical protein